MRWRVRLSSLLRNIFSRPRVERDLDDELRAYLDLAVDERRRAGMAAGPARRGALIEMQGLEQVKDQETHARSGAVSRQIRQDLPRAGRMSAKNHRLTAASA